MPDLNEIYSFLWNVHGDDFAILDRSLGPRSWEYMFELAASAGIHQDSLVVDVGCGRGTHCSELVSRFGCHAIGLDVVGTQKFPNVQLIQASIDQLPIQDESVDFVWCRDMLVHVPDPTRALRECARVLRAAGKMLIYTTLETELMEPREAQRLYRPLAIHPLRRDSLERSIASAGLTIARVEEIGGELIEFYQERDGRASRELMRIARMRRMREQLVAQWGPERYEAVSALYHWMIYLLIGKLTAAYYLLEKL
jgi:SAM-dependent methyltransferase